MDFLESKNNFQRKEINDSIFSNIICLTILLYLFRSTIPVLKYPFLLLYLFIIIHSIIYQNKLLPSNLLKFIRDYYISFLLAIILIASFLFSNKLYLVIFKDVLNTIILLSLFFFMSVYIKSKNQIDLF